MFVFLKCLSTAIIVRLTIVFVDWVYRWMANLHSLVPEIADCRMSTSTGRSRTASQYFSTKPFEQLQYVIDAVSSFGSSLNRPQ